jgi:hypothetical protein
MVAGNNPTDLRSALNEIKALKRQLADQRRQVEFEFRLLDLVLANIFEFLRTIESKGDLAEACPLVRENVATLIETAIQKFSYRDDGFTDGENETVRNPKLI